jgi:hypothetical protein
MRLRHIVIGALMIVFAIFAVQFAVTSFENQSYQEVDEDSGPPGAGTFIKEEKRKKKPGQETGR